MTEQLELALAQLSQLPPQAQDAIAELIFEELGFYTPVNQPSERVLGLHAHLDGFWMSEDFDAELPNEFWNWDQT